MEATAADLPLGWERGTDAHGPYYIDHNTRTTHRDPPPPPPAPSPAPPPPPAPSPAPAPPSWACTACSFLNKAALPRCEMCGTLSPLAKAQQADDKATARKLDATFKAEGARAARQQTDAKMAQALADTFRAEGASAAGARKKIAFFDWDNVLSSGGVVPDEIKGLLRDIKGAGIEIYIISSGECHGIEVLLPEFINPINIRLKLRENNVNVVGGPFLGQRPESALELERWVDARDRKVRHYITGFENKSKGKLAITWSHKDHAGPDGGGLFLNGIQYPVIKDDVKGTEINVDIIEDFWGLFSMILTKPMAKSEAIREILQGLYGDRWGEFVNDSFFFDDDKFNRLFVTEYNGFPKNNVPTIDGGIGVLTSGEIRKIKGLLGILKD